MSGVYCYNRTEAVQFVTLFVQDEIRIPGSRERQNEKKKNIY
jgi:hypothetical protein